MDTLIKFLIEFVLVILSSIFFTFGLRTIVLTVVLEAKESPDLKKISSIIIKGIVFFVIAFILLVQAVKM